MTEALALEPVQYGPEHPRLRAKQLRGEVDRLNDRLRYAKRQAQKVAEARLQDSIEMAQMDEYIRILLLDIERLMNENMRLMAQSEGIPGEQP
jgi:ribosomal protein S30